MKSSKPVIIVKRNKGKIYTEKDKLRNNKRKAFYELWCPEIWDDCSPIPYLSYYVKEKNQRLIVEENIPPLCKKDFKVTCLEEAMGVMKQLAKEFAEEFCEYQKKETGVDLEIYYVEGRRSLCEILFNPIINKSNYL